MLELNGKSIETDEEGFLLDPGEWDRTVAEQIAQDEQIELTTERWAVVQFVREHFDQRGTVPEARFVLKFLEQSYGKERARANFCKNCFPTATATGVQDRRHAQAAQTDVGRIGLFLPRSAGGAG